MKITDALKSWLVDNAGAAKDAADEVLIGLVAGCLTKAAGEDGHLTPDQLVELTSDETVKAANEFSSKLDTLLDTVGKLCSAIETKETVLAETPSTAPAAAADSDPRDQIIKQLTETIAKAAANVAAPEAKEEDSEPDAKASDIGRMISKAPSVRVKGAHEQYTDTKSEARFPQKTGNGYDHCRAGERVFEGSNDRGKRYIDESSELDKAVIGVWGKHLICRQTPGVKLNDHDVDLLNYAVRNYKFGGIIGGEFDYGDGISIGVDNRKLHDFEIKTLLDDSGGGLSGGLEIAPIVFDDQMILPALLLGELFPKVSVQTLTRGRRIEGASMGTVTIQSGGVDDSAISLFNTASFISAFDTTIHVAEGAIEIGLDFISDSPIAIANNITSQYGMVLQQWLDEQIAIGDGTTEPEGVMNASGTTSVGFNNNAPTLGEFESLLFGVAKAFKGTTDTSRIVFGGTETSYQRARAIPVGTADARRIGGMDYGSYTWMGHPFALNEVMANTQMFFANLARYRMYRRQGITFKTETGGKDLTLRNKMLITMRARFGGQLEDGGAAAVTTTAQA